MDEGKVMCLELLVLVNQNDEHVYNVDAEQTYLLRIQKRNSSKSNSTGHAYHQSNKTTTWMEAHHLIDRLIDAVGPVRGVRTGQTRTDVSRHLQHRAQYLGQLLVQRRAAGGGARPRAAVELELVEGRDGPALQIVDGGLEGILVGQGAGFGIDAGLVGDVGGGGVVVLLLQILGNFVVVHGVEGGPAAAAEAAASSSTSAAAAASGSSSSAVHSPFVLLLAIETENMCYYRSATK